MFDSEILPSGYTIYRRDRSCLVGGGILLAVSSVIPFRLICAATDVELIIVQIMLQKPIYLCCVYLPPPPNSDSVLAVFRYLSSFVHGDCPLILLGDFNLPDIDWCSLSASSIPSRMFFDKLLLLNYVQLVNCSTHVGGNILDLVITNCCELVEDLSVNENIFTGMSDHYVIQFHVPLITSGAVRNNSNKNKFCYCYDKVDTDGLLQHLSLFSPPPIIASNIDFVWNSLKQLMLESRDLFVSKSRLPTNVSPKWFNSKIRSTIHRVRHLRRKVRNSTTTYQLDKLEEMENHLQCLISDAKESYLLDMVSRFKDRPRALFSYFSRLTKVSGVPNTVHLGDLSASLSYDKANLFNSFFHSVMTNSNYILFTFFF